MKDNDFAIAAFELIVDLAGRRDTYDVNMNTNDTRSVFIMSSTVPANGVFSHRLPFQVGKLSCQVPSCKEVRRARGSSSSSETSTIVMERPVFLLRGGSGGSWC